MESERNMQESRFAPTTIEIFLYCSTRFSNYEIESEFSISAQSQT